MSPRRYLCSQLVELRWDGSSLTVNLEEIWKTGAILEAEEPAPMDVPADLHCGIATLCGRVTSVEKHDFGWRLEMEFSPLTPWSPERFTPAHLLDPSTLG